MVIAQVPFGFRQHRRARKHRAADSSPRPAEQGRRRSDTGSRHGHQSLACRRLAPAKTPVSASGTGRGGPLHASRPHTSSGRVPGNPGAGFSSTPPWRSRRQAGFRGSSPTPGGSHWAGRPDPRLRRWWWAVQASRGFRLGGAQGIGKMPRFVFRPKRRGSVHQWCGMVPTTSGRRRQLRDQLPHGYRAVRNPPLLDRLADGPCRKAPVLAASSHRQAMGGSGRTT